MGAVMARLRWKEETEEPREHGTRPLEPRMDGRVTQLGAARWVR